MTSTINILSKLHPLHVDKSNSWGNMSKEAWSSISCSKEFVDKLMNEQYRYQQSINENKIHSKELNKVKSELALARWLTLRFARKIPFGAHLRKLLARAKNNERY